MVVAVLVVLVVFVKILIQINAPKLPLVIRNSLHAFCDAYLPHGVNICCVVVEWACMNLIEMSHSYVFHPLCRTFAV